MSTALTILQNGGLALSDLEQLILAEAASDAAAFDPIPTKISISPGGVNLFTTTDGEAMRTFAGVIVLSQKARAYWPEKGTGAPPMCASHDGMHGRLVGEPTSAQFNAAMTAKTPHLAVPLLSSGKPLPDSFICAACPLSQYGSVHQGGAQGKGQACKSLRRLVVLVDGWAQPALLTLPPTSIRAFDGYASGLARRRSAYFAVRTKFSLEAQKSATGDPYSIASFAAAETLRDPAEVQAVIAIRRAFESLVRALPIEASEYDVMDENGKYVNGGEQGAAGAADADPAIPF